MEKANRDELDKLIQQLKEMIEKIKKGQPCPNLEQIIQEAKRYVENNAEGEYADLVLELLSLIFELIAYIHKLETSIKTQNVTKKKNENGINGTAKKPKTHKGPTKSKSR